MDSVSVLAYLSSIVISIVSSIWYYKYRKEQNLLSWQQDILDKAETITVDAPAALIKHSKEFHQSVVRIKDRIHVAIGYGLANVILIEGDQECILVDAGEGKKMMEEVLDNAFGDILEMKPVTKVILTHFHTDHSFGLSLVLERYPKAEVYAHDCFQDEYDKVMSIRGPITHKRSTFQFGMMVSQMVNAGIGPFLRLDEHIKGVSTVSPTHTFNETMDLKIGNLNFQLLHAPGETPDQIIVWWPEEKVLLAADNIYKAFPNLYAIRGTASRDTLFWCNSIDKMIALQPEVLVPQHTRPLLQGKEVVLETLTAYRDAIQFVHDQTFRMMNLGMSSDEIGAVIKLPRHLAEHPFLQEFYGTIEWSAKAVYNHYLGWFNGETSKVHELPNHEVAEMIVRLAKGGEKEVLEKAEQAFDNDELRWALKLCEAILLAEISSSYTQKAKALKVKTLRMLASKELSANGRNWYLTAALEEEGLKIGTSAAIKKGKIYEMKLSALFAALTVNVDPTKCENVTSTSHFHFTDIDQHFVLRLSQCVLRIEEKKPEKSEVITFRVTTTSQIWRQVMAKDLNPLMAWLKRELIVAPHIYRLYTFVGYFDF